MRIWIVHGFNTKGEQVTRLAQEFQKHGYDARPFFYGWTWLLSVWKVSKAVGKALASAVDEGDICIGHSNGCNVIHEAIAQGAPISQALYVSPALDADTPIPDDAKVKRIHVFHTPNDKAVKWAKRIPWSPWGDMGARGYNGKEPQYKNHEHVDVTDHSDWFSRIPWLFKILHGAIASAVPVNPGPWAEAKT